MLYVISVRWWCILAYHVGLLTCLTAKEDTVSIYPEDNIYVNYGKDLEMFCTAGVGTAQDLEFSLSSIPLTSEIVNLTTIRLYEKKPPEHERQTYFCTNKKTSKIDLKSIVVGSPPKEVKDFQCISKNIDILNCSWTTQDWVISTNYNLSYLVHGTPVKPCVASAVNHTTTRYCIFAANTIPRYRQVEEIFEFILIAYNVFGTKNENFTIDHYSVIKPDPPMHLHNISKSPHSVVLQWRLPDNIVHFLGGGIEHKIEYRISKIDDASKFRRVNTSTLPNNNSSYRFTISDLPYAHMQYEIRVYIKPVRAKSDFFWSDFNSLVFYTASESPSRPPEIPAGAFRQNKFESYRVVHVYWKQLDESEEAGGSFTYKIVVNHGSSTETLFPDKNKSLGLLTLDTATLDAMNIYIWSFNEIGSSVNSSHLYIPPESETHSLAPTSFTTRAYGNGTYELSWFGTHNIDNYTLFWCHMQTAVSIDTCYGRINFVVLDGKKNKHVINLPKDYNYQFAISANKGARTSGMILAECGMSNDKMLMNRRADVPNFTQYNKYVNIYLNI